MAGVVFLMGLGVHMTADIVEPEPGSLSMFPSVAPASEVGIAVGTPRWRGTVFVQSGFAFLLSDWHMGLVAATGEVRFGRCWIGAGAGAEYTYLGNLASGGGVFRGACGVGGKSGVLSIGGQAFVPVVPQASYRVTRPADVLAFARIEWGVRHVD